MFLRGITMYYPDIHDVRIEDAYFSPFIDKMANITTPDVLEKFLADGAVENYRRVAEGKVGGHGGPPWYHGLICETIRGMADLTVQLRNNGGGALADSLEKRIDDVVDAMKAAQNADKDGWLNPYTTLERPTMRWGLNGGNARWQHETYNTGALIEAGIHYYLSSGKTELLKIAVKMANYFADRIGEAPKYNVVCEHSLPELSLAYLENLLSERPELVGETGAKPGEYIRLAKFFCDHKGDNLTRHQYPKFLQEYAQDHRPAAEQREAVGHAVRATLFYAGMTKTARDTSDKALFEAAYSIWHDITETKLHINGCVGAYRDDERFGAQYELPNDGYLETCAGVGLVFFGQEMYLSSGEASVWDTVESTLFNLMPASVALDGVHYSYENPIESRGGRERWSWTGCPCCPPMLLKLAGELPELIWSVNENEVSLNLFIGSELRHRDLVLRYDKSAEKIYVSGSGACALRIRIPEWADGISASCGSRFIVKDGYLCGDVKAGDEISLDIKAHVRRIMAHPWVAADRGRAAIKYREVLYCAEKEVKNWEDLDPVLDISDPQLNEDGTVSVTSVDGEVLKLIRYRDWNNNGPLPMRVWFRQSGLISAPGDLTGWDGKLYREFR